MNSYLEMWSVLLERKVECLLYFLDQYSSNVFDKNVSSISWESKLDPFFANR